MRYNTTNSNGVENIKQHSSGNYNSIGECAQSSRYELPGGGVLVTVERVCSRSGVGDERRQYSRSAVPAREITKNIRHQSNMKSYSVDLRQKIISVYETEPISQRKLAKRFCVALSFVQKLLKQYRQTKDISPQTHRCSGPLKLTPEQLVILAKLIETNNDATLEELCRLLYEKIGVTISRATMGRMTQRLNMTFKKNALPLRQRQ